MSLASGNERRPRVRPNGQRRGRLNLARAVVLLISGLLVVVMADSLYAQGSEPELTFFVETSDRTVDPGESFYFDFGVGRRGGAWLNGVAFELHVEGDVRDEALTVMRGPARIGRYCNRDPEGSRLRIRCSPPEEMSRAEVLIVLRLRLEAASGPQEVRGTLEPVRYTHRLPTGHKVRVIKKSARTQVRQPARRCEGRW